VTELILEVGESLDEATSEGPWTPVARRGSGFSEPPTFMFAISGRWAECGLTRHQYLDVPAA